MKTRKRLLVSLVIFAFALSVLMPGFAEEKVKLSDCPEPVQKTVKENAAGGTITYEAEIKTSDGKVIEIEIEVEVAEDGKVLKTESTMMTKTTIRLLSS